MGTSDISLVDRQHIYPVSAQQQTARSSAALVGAESVAARSVPPRLSVGGDAASTVSEQTGRPRSDSLHEYEDATGQRLGRRGSSGYSGSILSAPRTSLAWVRRRSRFPIWPGKQKNLRFEPAKAALQKAYTMVKPRFTRADQHRTSFGGRSTGQMSAGSIFDTEIDKRPRWKARVASHVEGIRASVIVLFFTFLALFMDDFRLLALPPSLDGLCEVLACLILVVFATETFLYSLLRQKYFLRLYFWIDFVAMLSMLFDIPLLANPVGGNPDPLSGVGQSPLARHNTAAWEARARSIMRVARILRVMRLIKLYQQYQAYKANVKIERELGIASRTSQAPWWSSSAVQHSRVGQKLSDLTTLRVVIGILALLLIVPAFNIASSLYGNAPTINHGGLIMLYQVYAQDGASTAFRESTATYLMSSEYALISRRTGYVLNLIIANQTVVDTRQGFHLRTVEMKVDRWWSQECHAQRWGGCWENVAVHDIRWDSQFAALLNLLRTAFICAAICAGTILFNRDAAQLVLQPIDRMLKQVKDVSENPLARRRQLSHDQKGGPLMETRILENAINKICALLAIGFGDAGAEVIGNNIRSGGDLKPIVPGQKVAAIFGFCDIRQFTDATEVLQQEVMEFVNTIARIVHMEVALHGGAPNKNIGDAFLLVWKLPEQYAVRRSLSVQDAALVAAQDSGGDIAQDLAAAGRRGTRELYPYARPMQRLTLSNASSAAVPVGGRMTRSAGSDGASGLDRQSGSSTVKFDLDSEGSGTLMLPAEGSRKASWLQTALTSSKVVPLLHEGSERLSGLTKRLSWAPGAAGEPRGKPDSPLFKADLSRANSEADLHALDESVNQADRALAAFVIIQAALKRSPRLRSYSLRDDLNSRMPNFQVRMGFGLHVGWAIEGAIGSEYKIDASYLSPNVNMASRLEAATKQFGTTILFSGDFAGLLSRDIRARVRQIDCVTVKGSAQPMALFTYDVTTERIPDGSELPGASADSDEEAATFSMQEYESEFLEHPDLACTWAVSMEFLQRFAEGLTAYLAGNWPHAVAVLSLTCTMRRSEQGLVVVDGPSRTLLDFMAGHGNQKPAHWKGFRELTDK